MQLMLMMQTVAADAHDAARGVGQSAETAAADARDAVFAEILVWKPLQLMLMMLLVSAWNPSRHILIMQR